MNENIRKLIYMGICFLLFVSALAFFMDLNGGLTSYLNAAIRTRDKMSLSDSSNVTDVDIVSGEQVIAAVLNTMKEKITVFVDGQVYDYTFFDMDSLDLSGIPNDGSYEEVYHMDGDGKVTEIEYSMR